MRFSTVAFLVVVSVVSWFDAESAIAGDGVRYLRNTSLLPIVISRSGTYRLKSDLVATNPDVSVIRIEADDVTIDLNGFAIRGPAVCDGMGINVECTGTGGGVGIMSEPGGPRLRAVRVINGSIRGVGSTGIYGAAIWDIENVRLVSNGQNGLDVRGQGQILGVNAHANYRSGIVSEGVQVKDSDSSHNRFSGIEVVDANVTNCVAASNGASGISADGAVVLGSNVVLANLGQGIEARGSVVVNNAVHSNQAGAASCTNCAFENNVFYLNPADGSAQVGVYSSTFRGNSVEANSDDGGLRSADTVVAESYISSSSGAATALLSNGGVGIAGNVIMGGFADVGGPGVTLELGANVCGVDTTCP